MVSVKGCPAGLFCPPQLATLPTLVANSCPLGAFCEFATPAPALCPAGSFNPRTGQSVCTPCTPGSYCILGAVLVSGSCSPGYFCPQNSTGQYEVACPGGTYRATPGAVSVNDCLQCSAGTYCPVGTAHPVDCPQGSLTA